MTTPRADPATSVFTARGHPSAPGDRPRRRTVARIRRLSVVGTGLAAVAALTLAATAATSGPPAGGSDGASPVAVPSPPSDEPVGAGTGGATAPAPAAPQLAHLGRVTLHLPSPSATFIGFHEAASTTALALTASSELTTDLTHRAVRVEPRPAGDLGARPVVALPPRGRAAAATSAIDIVLPAAAGVHAPVTGTVVEVQDYALYRHHPDTRIGIVPTVDPGVVVTLIHIDDPQVRPGDEVTAGETVIAARARRLPFASQIDTLTARSADDPDPHVHLEVKPYR